MLRDKRECYYCGQTTGLHVHHIFYGTANRSKSEKYKKQCTVYLCHRCHNIIHTDPKFKLLDVRLKKKAEEKWISELNKTKDDFIAEFGRNYL